MTEITPLPYRGGIPFSTATPFTYREGVTMLELVHALKDWAINIIPDLNGVLEEFWTKYTEDHAAILADLEVTKDNWQQFFDQFMADVVAQLEALNDQAAANLVNNESSLLRNALDALIYDSKRVRTSLVYYVSTTGSDSNDGKTEFTPRATVNSIIAETQDDFYGVDTEIIINVAPGSYDENVRFENTTGEIKRYRIRGAEVPHPIRPITIWTAGLGATQSGFIVRSKSIDLTVEYIEFYGYNGNASAGGIVLADAKLTTNNAHFRECFWGITASRADLNVPNGVFENCGRLEGSSSAGAGVRSLMLTNHSIGNQYGSTGDSAIFRSNNYGFLAQESSVGHVDHCTFENNDYGVVARVNSRANAATSVFTGNGTAILATGSSNVLASINSFGAGNTYDHVARSGGVVSLTTFDAFIKGADIAGVTAPEKFAATYDSITHTGPSAYIYEKLLTDKFWNMGKSTRYPARKLNVKLNGFIAGSNTGKTLGLRLGLASQDAAVSFDLPATMTGPFVCDITIAFREPGVQILSGVLTVSGASPLVSSSVTTVNMVGDVQARVYASTASSSDTVNIRAIEFYVER